MNGREKNNRIANLEIPTDRTANLCGGKRFSDPRALYEQLYADIERTGNITQVCKKAGVSRVTYYKWRIKYG